jgi:hypothetical protein
MLEGIRSNAIIVGAYSTREGICPMLAAHRAGGRTSCISFAKAWDRFALAGSRGRPRRASERELRVLAAHLEMSLLDEEAASGGLAGAIADHRSLVESRPPAPARRAQATTRPGDPDRSGELRATDGWAWTRIVRRYDDFQATLRRATSEREPAPA